MSRFTKSNSRSHSARLPLLAIVLTLALSALLGPAAAGAKQAAPKPVDVQHVAKKSANATLGATILTTLKGRTLYTLSAETNGRFVCTGSCLSSWHPLIITVGVTPTGPVKLGTIARPEGRIQVTFKGRPLYTFTGDTRAGQANGEGIRDVGVWHAAKLAKITPNPGPTSPGPAPEPSYPY